MVGDGDESDPSVKWRGRSVDVAEAFEFPFESPPGGCLLRYNFLVQDGYELGFSVRCATCPALEGTPALGGRTAALSSAPRGAGKARPICSPP